MLLTVTSCCTAPWRVGIPASLSMLIQIWAVLLLDGDIFKVSKNKTAEKAALTLLKQLRRNTGLPRG